MMSNLPLALKGFSTSLRRMHAEEKDAQPALPGGKAVAAAILRAKIDKPTVRRDGSFHDVAILASRSAYEVYLSARDRRPGKLRIRTKHAANADFHQRCHKGASRCCRWVRSRLHHRRARQCGDRLDTHLNKLHIECSAGSLEKAKQGFLIGHCPI